MEPLLWHICPRHLLAAPTFLQGHGRSPDPQWEPASPSRGSPGLLVNPHDCQSPPPLEDDALNPLLSHGHRTFVGCRGRCHLGPLLPRVTSRHVHLRKETAEQQARLPSLERPVGGVSLTATHGEEGSKGSWEGLSQHRCRPFPDTQTHPAAACTPTPQQRTKWTRFTGFSSSSGVGVSGQVHPQTTGTPGHALDHMTVEMEKAHGSPGWGGGRQAGPSTPIPGPGSPGGERQGHGWHSSQS